MSHSCQVSAWSETVYEKKIVLTTKIWSGNLFYSIHKFSWEEEAPTFLKILHTFRETKPNSMESRLLLVKPQVAELIKIFF
jgi:hypothetical protein